MAFPAGAARGPGARQEIPTKDADERRFRRRPGNERAGDSNARGDSRATLSQATSLPELAWADAARARSFDGAMRARVAALRVRLRTSVAGAETRRPPPRERRAGPGPARRRRRGREKRRRETFAFTFESSINTKSTLTYYRTRLWCFYNSHYVRASTIVRHVLHFHRGEERAAAETASFSFASSRASSS